MDVLNGYIAQTEALLEGCAVTKLTAQPPWPSAEKNPFLLTRDTAVELGGYPKESVNLLLSSSTPLTEEGVYLLGDNGLLSNATTHCSFGKIVLLDCGELPTEECYDYLKSVEFVDYRLQLRDVMVRTSSQQFFANLRIGTGAKNGGFNLERLGAALLERYRAIPQVRGVKILFLLGENPLYKQLLPIAQRVKEVTAAMNQMLDGMELDCASCKLSTICAEVEGLRELHAAARKEA
ncbi:MAG: hypothetical protein RR807_01090 [Oscillospiraceae bacterium]